MKSRAIGIFDSGMGGLSVLNLAATKLPNENFIYYGDSLNAPYGTKSKEELVDLCIEICDYLISRNVKTIIIACNTATSAAVDILRNKYDIPIIGMEPALKPAIENNIDGIVAVMATPMTLKEEKFNRLLSKTEANNKIYKIPAPKIVELVEKGVTEGIEMDEVLAEYFEEISNENIDSIVLGCTHFVFIKESILKYFDDNINLYDGNEGTVNQLIRILNEIELMEKNTDVKSGNIELINTGGEAYMEVSRKLLERLRGE